MLKSEMFCHCGGVDNEAISIRTSILEAKDSLDVNGTIYFIS